MAAGVTAWCLPAWICVQGTPAGVVLGGTEHPRVEQGAGPSTIHALSAGQRDAAWLGAWQDTKKKEAQTTGVCLGFGFGASFLELPWKRGLRARGAARREPCAPRGCLGSGVPEPAGGVLGGGCAAMSVCRHGNLLQPRSPAAQGSLRRNVHPRARGRAERGRERKERTKMEKARGWNRGGLRAGLNAAHVPCQNEARGGGRWLLQISAAPRRRADPWCWDALVCTHIPLC